MMFSPLQKKSDLSVVVVSSSKQLWIFLKSIPRGEIAWMSGHPLEDLPIAWFSAVHHG
jgi:hypothetical protein